jgi:hypothetical protein
VGFDSPSLRCYLRLAARKSTSRAQVDVLPPAARSSSARSSSVSRIRNCAALRSSGDLGGRPRTGVASMRIIVEPQNMSASPLTWLFNGATINAVG